MVRRLYWAVAGQVVDLPREKVGGHVELGFEIDSVYEGTWDLMEGEEMRSAQWVDLDVVKFASSSRIER
jgi:hypothetical protein